MAQKKKYTSINNDFEALVSEFVGDNTVYGTLGGLSRQEARANVERGYRGEEYIRKKVSNNGYQALLSVGSRTKADVYAHKNCGFVQHIMLVQVKTSIDTPKTLNERQKESLRKLAVRFHEFLASHFEVNILVSYGYAGVKEDAAGRMRLHSKEYFGRVPKIKPRNWQHHPKGTIEDGWSY